MENEIKKDIQIIIDYLHEEKKNWEENDKPLNHIYNNIKRVSDYLNK